MTTTTTYKNSFYCSKRLGSQKDFERSENPEIYKGYEIHKYNYSQWHVVKDGVCVGMNAGPNGARRKVDTLIIQSYILQSIDLSGYEMENTPENLYNVFLTEKPQQGIQERAKFLDWLQGEPSAFASTTIFEDLRAELDRLQITVPDSLGDMEVMKTFQGMIYDNLKLML